jgi:IclR family acetate operon transcriptional repressor
VTPERLAEIGPLVREAATEITRMIGGLADGSPSEGPGAASLFEVSATRLP